MYHQIQQLFRSISNRHQFTIGEIYNYGSSYSSPLKLSFSANASQALGNKTTPAQRSAKRNAKLIDCMPDSIRLTQISCSNNFDSAVAASEKL